MNEVIFELFGLPMTGWTIFGFSFQACFMARFLVQWLASEKAGRSVVPKAFWYLSLMGASGLLTYAVVHLQDPVIAIGQSTGFIIYIRNLVLIKRTKNAEELERTGEKKSEDSQKL